MRRDSARAVLAAAALLLTSGLTGTETGSAAGGIRWSIPGGWLELPARAMRVGTYRVGTAAKGSDPVECAVFYFGEGRGGGIDENIQRWAAQFDGAPAPKRSTRTVRGLRVHLADISGAYLAPGGPMMQSQGKKPGWRLLGAVVQGPEGLVFFKLTGPAAGVAAAERQFAALIDSLSPAATRA